MSLLTNHERDTAIERLGLIPCEATRAQFTDDALRDVLHQIDVEFDRNFEPDIEPEEDDE